MNTEDKLLNEIRSRARVRYDESNREQILPKRKTKPSKEEKQYEEERHQRRRSNSAGKFADGKRKSRSSSLKSEDFESSGVRRERIKKINSKLVVSTMRKALPRYSLSEIRQFRLPFHEALIVNLQESGFPSSASYIEALIEFQDNLRRESGPGSSIFVQPQLKFGKNELGILSSRLQKAEIHHNKGSYVEECSEFLGLGVQFAFSSSPDWWWVGEQILIQSIKVSSRYSTEIGEKYEALSRFSYAKFLLDNVKEYENASKQLKITRHLCSNKVWTSKQYFPEIRGTLFMQTNHALFECIMKEVKRLMETDMEAAMILSDQARKRAAEACYRNGETRALVLRGICEMRTKRPKSAINSLLRALNIQERFGTIEGMCKIRIHLARAYLMDDCGNSSLNTLMQLKDDAEQNNLPFYLAQAYKNLGEYYLMIGHPDKATPLLAESVKIFNSFDVKSTDIHAAQNLKAISGGLQLFPKFVEVLKKAGECGYTGRYNLLALLQWKNERIDFWTDADHVIAYTSCDEIILECRNKVEKSRPDILNEKLLTLASKCAIQEQIKEPEFLADHDKHRLETSTISLDEETKHPQKSFVEVFATKINEGGVSEITIVRDT